MVQEGELALTSPLINAADTIVGVDSVATVSEPVYALVLTAPTPPPPAPPRPQGNLGVSFILCGVFILFLIIALKFRNNIKYVLTIFRNLVETRTRHNFFDDTVRETSLIVLLNILWCVSAGIIGFCVFRYFNPYVVSWSHRSIGMLWGMAFAVVYIIFMWFAYSAVGWIFSDSQHSQLWVKGFSASQALMSPAFFITALVGISHPDTGLGVGIAALIVFIIGKLVFIWKGYRIFFNQFSSWVLFLCYLCSLEIVPLILCYRGAILLGEIL